jgi:5-methylcytosine-specific restriction endonuclease McrA
MGGVMSISKKDRELIFQKYGGKCAYCGCELQKGWHIDHLKPINRYSESVRDERGFVVRDENYNVKRVMKIGRPENDVLENMNPACASCNINKHSLTIEGFRDLINGFLNSLNQRSTQYKFAKKYGLLEETGNPVIFYFEKTGEQ